MTSKIFGDGKLKKGTFNAYLRRTPRFKNVSKRKACDLIISGRSGIKHSKTTVRRARLVKQTLARKQK